MQATLLVALGGAVGSVARYWVSVLAVWVMGGEAFPWGTLVINVLGSFVIGLFAALTGPEGRLAGDASTRLLIMVGLCGGFTTFSSFSLQTLTLLRGGAMAAGLINIAASVLLCLLATAAGAALVTKG
jgi:CrcB protein